MVDVHCMHHQPTGTCTFIVSCRTTKAAAVIDSVRDFSLESGRTSWTHADSVVEYVKSNGLRVEWVLETHVHADHLTG